PLFDAVRRSHPGQIEREPRRWDTRLGLLQTPWSPRDSVVRAAVHTGPNGDLDGYIIYRTEDSHDRRRPGSRLNLSELMALTQNPSVALWRFCSEMALIGEVRAGMRSPDEPLLWLLDNPRAAVTETHRGDLLWLRPLDIPRLLSTRRYATSGSLVIDVTDPI